jgi:hypothetical protein
MNEYTSLGHMEQVQDDQINDKEEAYYLPLHARLVTALV